MLSRSLSLGMDRSLPSRYTPANDPVRPHVDDPHGRGVLHRLRVLLFRLFQLFALARAVVVGLSIHHRNPFLHHRYLEASASGPWSFGPAFVLLPRQGQG